MPEQTAHWVAEIQGKKLSDDLVKFGLIERRAANQSNTTLKDFVDAYITEFSPTVKRNTVITWTQCKRLLYEKFDIDMLLTDFSTGHAIQFRNHLLTRGNGRTAERKGLAETTVRKRCACAKQFFAHAVALRVIDKNPFDTKKVPTNSFKADQKELVTPAMAEAVIERLPDWQWRALFALARYGGLRVPSEPQLLRWADIDWEGETMLIHSPKTEHHRGHETRRIPIFGELKPYLHACWDLAEAGEELVLPMLRGKSNSYCRKPVIAAIEAAGLPVWNKLFSTLRANRDTELREDLPGHVVDAWIGHDERVAKRNYLQIREEHFQQATRRKVDAKSDAAPVGNNGQGAAQESRNVLESAGIDTVCCLLHERANPTSGGDRNRTCTSEETRS